MSNTLNSLESVPLRESWVSNKWRPTMGWMYMTVCICDFIIFPAFWTVVQMKAGGDVTSQWSPITLHGAGFFHIAMGAVLGIAVYGRTQEKINSSQSFNNGNYHNQSVSGDYWSTNNRNIERLRPGARPSQPEYPVRD